jgi:hypothetical protein
MTYLLPGHSLGLYRLDLCRSLLLLDPLDLLKGDLKGILLGFSILFLLLPL